MAKRKGTWGKGKGTLYEEQGLGVTKNNLKEQGIGYNKKGKMVHRRTTTRVWRQCTRGKGKKQMATANGKREKRKEHGKVLPGITTRDRCEARWTPSSVF
jgi:hypothetical protein